VLINCLVVQYSRDPESELTTLFQLLVGDGKESITASDLVVLANEMGDALSKEEAEAMLGDKKNWTIDDVRSALLQGRDTNQMILPRC
jgi:Ca2+-binding EF-hand superfamily protein